MCFSRQREEDLFYCTLLFCRKRVYIKSIENGGMCTHVCLVCVCVYVCACVCMCVQVCVHVCVHVCACVCGMCVHVCACVRHVCVHVCVHVCMEPLESASVCCVIVPRPSSG